METNTQQEEISANYFETLGIPLLEGRVFTPDEMQSRLPVVVVNETMANSFWPEEGALGRRVKHHYDAWRRLVAVEDQEGEKVTYAYDSFGNRAEAIDRLGNAFHYSMTPAGLPSETMSPSTNGAQIAYDALSNPLQHLDELGRLTQFGYDPSGNLTVAAGGWPRRCRSLRWVSPTARTSALPAAGAFFDSGYIASFIASKGTTG